MKKQSKLVFFGNERLVSGLKHSNTPVLKGLIERGYDIVAVIASHSDGTSRNARALEVARVAREHNIPVLTPDKPVDIINELVAYKADAAILSAYGRILPQRIIDVFGPLGIINIHPSLLPRHRGPTPIEATILEGDNVAGVSIMQLTAGMDTGPIYAQASFNIRHDIPKFELYEELSNMGATLLFDVLPDILSGALQPKPQQNVGVSVTTRLLKTYGVLDPTTDTAEVLERKIRAYQGYPKPHLTVHDKDVIITSSKVVENFPDNALLIPCAENTWLEVTSLVAPSGREMSAQDFLRGYKQS